jgi:hypothetical protein
MATNSEPGKGDVYLQFNGRDNYVEIPSIGDYSITTTGELAVAVGRIPSIFRAGKERAMCTGSERARARVTPVSRNGCSASITAITSRPDQQDQLLRVQSRGWGRAIACSRACRRGNCRPMRHV